jgi:hypothetical protein
MEAKPDSDEVLVAGADGLEPGKPLELAYRLRATMPARVAVSAAHVYEYYNSDKQGVRQTSQLTVLPR